MSCKQYTIVVVLWSRLTKIVSWAWPCRAVFEDMILLVMAYPIKHLCTDTTSDACNVILGLLHAIEH